MVKTIEESMYFDQIVFSDPLRSRLDAVTSDSQVPPPEPEGWHVLVLDPEPGISPGPQGRRCIEATGQPGTAKTKRRPSTPRCPPLKGTAPLVNVEVVVLPATAVVSKAITTSTKSFWVSNPLLASQGVLLTPSPRWQKA